MTRISETLRIEMEPLGVQVVTVILGAVDTSGNDPNNREELQLPANSYYQNITSVINRHKKGLVHVKKHDVDVAANNVVNDVLSGRGGFVWRGYASSLTWLLTTFLPYAVTTKMINGESGLDKLKR